MVNLQPDTLQGDRPMANGEAGPQGGQSLLTRIATLIFGPTRTPEQSAANQGWILVLSGTAAAGLILIGVVAVDVHSFAAGCLLAIAASMVGALTGFLFGLPRSARTDVVTRDHGAPAADSQRIPVETRSSGYKANTNLEDISDWLTKILVGVGLTQLTSIPNAFKDLVDAAKVAMGVGADSGAIAGSVLVGYVLIGFLSTYLWARTRLGEALRLADLDSTERLKQVEASVNDLRATLETASRNPSR
jgi:hypothetical protein